MSAARPGSANEPEARARWRQLAWQLYECLPRAADRPLHVATRTLLPVTNRHLPLTLLRGPVAGGGSGCMLFAGAPAAAPYLSQRFFAAAPAAETLGSVPVWRVAGELARRRPDVDLVVARLDRISAALALDESYVAVPEWVGAQAAVPADVARFCRGNKSLSHNLGRVRRAGMRPEVSHAAADFDEFYDRFYLPFTRRRHGAESVVSDRTRLRRSFRQGGIMWIRHGEERAAGLLFRTRGRSLDLVAIGMAEEPFDPRREAAAFALAFHLFEHAQRLGCTIVDFGTSRPSPRDGLLLYKARWGARIVPSRTTFYDLFLSWDQLGAPLVDFLARTPLIFRQADGLAALWGPQADTGIRAARHLLRSLRRIYLLDDAVAPGPEAALPVVRVDPGAEPCWRPTSIPRA